MSLPDFVFYDEKYMGIAIPEEDFQRYILRADEVVKQFERTYTVTGEEVDRWKALCAIAEAMSTEDTILNAVFAVDENGVARTGSISIGSVSTSAKSIDPAVLGLDTSEKGRTRLYYSLLQKYMAVYRGVNKRCSP